ncbi:hypothetical protein G9C85_16195 [Halorubellus sp. JP-L1]|nr:hypothetical protein [Halorubellus sp. JP-L1]
MAVDLGESERYRLLADSTRRAVLTVLDDTAAPVALQSLARDAAAARYSSGDPPDEVVEQTTVALHHNHLPRLADAGLVEYDRDRKRVVDCSNEIAVL